jgi:FeS assembly SUF system regulator
MLKMSKLADYGTVILTTMVRNPEHLKSAAEIASAIHVPVPTVSKILKMLAREGLVLSLRGAKGGYMLSRPANEISVAEIIQAMDGPIGMTECSITPGLCTQESNCTVRANWQRINRIVMQSLEQITLDEMIRPIAQPVDTRALRAAKSNALNGELS